MKKNQTFLLLIFFLFQYQIACASPNSKDSTLPSSSENLIKKIDFIGSNKLEISVSIKSDFKVFTLENPNRLVVDVSNANLGEPNYSPTLPDFVKTFRTSNNKNSLRLVFELTKKVVIEKSRFEKVLNQSAGKIISVFVVSGSNPSTPVSKSNTISSSSETKILAKIQPNIPPKSTEIAQDKPAKQVTKNIRIPVVIIDAGHGGKDPGTIGNFARTKEKNITLSYAKEFGKHLANTKRYKVYLTRDTDNFIPLRDRVALARKKKADLFISLHANASPDEDVEGFSIYTLSENSSDKQAELLAQKENRSDIINGIDFSGASPDIVKTLIDMAQRDSKNSSSRFANGTIKSIQNSEINILQNTHRFAGFMVLTAPDMPSVLIELGYLSNKHEEKLLNSIGYKRKVAESLTKAIDGYFKNL